MKQTNKRVRERDGCTDNERDSCGA